MIDKGATKPEVFVCWAHGDDAWEQTVTAFVKALNDSGRVCAEFDGSYRDKSGGDWPGRFEKVVESRSATVLIVYNERWGRASDCHDPLTHTPAGYESWLIRSDLASARPGSREKYMVVLLDGFAQDRIRGSQYPLHRVVIPAIPSERFDQLLAAIRGRSDIPDTRRVPFSLTWRCAVSTWPIKAASTPRFWTGRIVTSDENSWGRWRRKAS